MAEETGKETLSAQSPNETHRRWRDATLVGTGLVSLAGAEIMVTHAFSRIQETGVLEKVLQTGQSFVDILSKGLSQETIAATINSIEQTAQAIDDADAVTLTVATSALLISGSVGFLTPLVISEKE